MNINNSLHVLMMWVLPMNSNRRMVGRVIKQIALSPTTVNARINPVNLMNFLHYRKYIFHCPICGNYTTPLYDFPNLRLRREHKIGVLRETLQCRECFASMRQRSLALALLDYLYQRTAVRHQSIAALADAGLGGMRVLDTDNFSAISNLLRGVFGYTRCSYLPDKPYGTEIESNYYNINLEQIDFCNASFDIVLTSNVMEHVRNSDAAHAEIERILTPNGAYIFNIPYDENMESDIQLVDTSSSEDRHLCEPQYHGDPLTGGILAYRVFGRTLLTKLASLGFQVLFRRIEQPTSLVTDGDVFVAIKKAK